jgi:hypothetical protein
MLILSYSIFIVNMLFGLCVKFKVIDSKKFKFLHHVIYFIVMLSLIITTSLTALDKNFVNMFQLLIPLFFLSFMPKFSGHKTAHWQYALVCFVVYTTGFILTLN